ncbi:hypothetical protein BYT27DRAFT_7187931 [Phlegmacium glaucopus]|nr:hypothetical protein BYT27DRAFT_7187931 [Phlegmacium glaucopus]
MIGLPFRSPEEQEVFTDNLVRSCTSIVHFTYQPGADLDPFPGPEFGISGLEHLSWKTERALPLESPIISIMTASMTTLTHISFTGYLSLIEPTYYDFLDLRFPLLTSLEFGSLFDTTSQERLDTAVTRFINDHPHINRLSLGRFRSSRTGTTSFQFDQNLLRNDSLPNLRSFEGFPMNITLLAHCNVQCLLELTTLSLFSDSDDLPSMFEAVRSRLGSGNLPCVRNLRFEFRTDLSHKMETNASDLVHRRWADGFSEICPAVVNWYGTLGPVTRDNLANVFNVYEHLETINLPRLSLNLYIPAKDPAINSYFRTIAEQCPELRRIVARKPAYTELEDYVFGLRRKPNGDLDHVRHGILDGGEDRWNLVDGEE